MIDARTQYILYKERENELMVQIEQIRSARERGALCVTSPSWIAAAEKWLKQSFRFGKASQTPLQQRQVSC